MALLTPAKVSSSHFVLVRRGALADVSVCEISDFGPGFTFGRVYDDACDEGITVHSSKTGLDVVFVIDDTYRDSDGDVQYWDLVSVTPGNAGHRLRIYND